MLFPSNGGGHCILVEPLPSAAALAVPPPHSVVEPVEGIKTGAVTLSGLDSRYLDPSEGLDLQVMVGDGFNTVVADRSCDLVDASKAVLM